MTIRRATPEELAPSTTVSRHVIDCNCSATSTDPRCEHLRDLAALDEEIARLRGWIVSKAVGAWQSGRAPDVDGIWHDEIRALAEHPSTMTWDPMGDAPPPFSSSWSLAGPLLEEMAESAAFPSDGVMLLADRFDGGDVSWFVSPGARFVRGYGPDGGGHTATSLAFEASGGGRRSIAGPESIARAWRAWAKAHLASCSGCDRCARWTRAT